MSAPGVRYAHGNLRPLVVAYPGLSTSLLTPGVEYVHGNLEPLVHTYLGLGVCLPVHSISYTHCAQDTRAYNTDDITTLTL